MGRRFEPDGAHVLSLAEIHKSGDYLTHEKLWSFSLQTPQVEYRNAAHLFTSSRWRGFDWEDIRQTTTTGQVLVIGHDDTLITGEMLMEIQRIHSFKAIFASNLDPSARPLDNVFDLPLGIPNNERQSRTHIVQADQSLVRRAWKASAQLGKKLSPRLYSNFSVRTNPRERQNVLEIVQSLPGVKKGKFQLSKGGRFRDLRNLASSKLVVCPRGHGLDTHRFWESLLVGAIPIVLAHDHCAIIARSYGLPHIALSDWEELRDFSQILEAWEITQSTSWDYSPLSSLYWKSTILAKAT